MSKVTKRPAPAYQEFASDILANAQYRMMSLAERGLLDTMRKECWVNGRIPASSIDISEYLKFDALDIQRHLTKKVLSFFIQIDDYLVCPELEGYRANLEERHRKMAEGGKNGGIKTQTKNKKNQATLEGTLKPLSRDDSSRHEVIGEELGYKPPSVPIDFNSSPKEINEWIKQHNESIENMERLYPSESKISTR